MLQDYKDVIIKNFVILMKECDVEVLARLMVNKGVFTEKEKNDIFSSNDARHNKRVFFFSIQKKETSAFKILINSLRETNQNSLADLLMPKHKGCVAFQEEQVVDDVENMVDFSSLNLIVNDSTTPLNVKVIPSSKFYDTYHDNPNIDFYYTRSKKRGRVLIMNNYDFEKTDGSSDPERYRNGALVDNENLKSLFHQMGGWDIEHHNNKSAEEMEIILNNFSQQQKNVDIIFVIIMSHGSDRANDTIIHGRDNKFISSLNVQKKFSNESSKSLRGKPKIFILPVCRGLALDLVIQHDPSQRTETDSAHRKADSVRPVSSLMNIRSDEDMLIGYATLIGSKAHRDPYRGSWYIELMCDVFMKHAHNTPVDNLLSIIDNKLRKRMSENQTMQTAEFRNKGFKKLYLHPGIFSVNGEMKKFHE